MHKIAVVLAALLVAGLGVLSPAAAAPARAASVNPKVAIIVGATGSATPTYRSYGDQLYAEAIKYTTNVVRVYSPDATWARVQAAVNGASIIVYLGHGNGWPAPYPNDATYSQKDGFGLNYDVNGDGKYTDSELKYYGEPAIRTLTPAPNAVVLLFHLCYASGNSEPGLTDPTLSVALQRADNYAAAFQAMGARAVIAIGHSHDPYYIRALFTMHESIRDYFTQAPDAHNNVLQYASVRTPGRTELLDPDMATPWGFWRSLTGDMTLNTAEVTGGASSNAGGASATISAPRVWAVDDGAGTFSPDGNGVSDTMPISIRLSETATWRLAITDSGGRQLTTSSGQSDTATLTWAPAAHAVADGTYHWQLTATDAYGNGPLEASGDITVDTVPPTLIVAGSTTPRVFSPDGDGFGDTVGIAVSSSEDGTALASVLDATGATVDTIVAPLAANAATVTWDGRTSGGAPARDGTYTISLAIRDLAGNSSVAQARQVVLDRTLGHLTESQSLFFPQDGDTLSPSVAFGFTLAGPATVDWSVVNANGSLVRSIATAQRLAAGTYSFTWDGRDNRGSYVPRGTYRAVVTAADALATQTRALAVMADAFRIVPSTTTPGRGQRITLTATASESLGTAPRLVVVQSGIKSFSVGLSRVSAGVYRATFILRSSAAGTARINVSAVDSLGHPMVTNLILRLH